MFLLFSHFGRILLESFKKWKIGSKIFFLQNTSTGVSNRRKILCWIQIWWKSFKKFILENLKAKNERKQSFFNFCYCSTKFLSHNFFVNFLKNFFNGFKILLYNTPTEYFGALFGILEILKLNTSKIAT